MDSPLQLTGWRNHLSRRVPVFGAHTPTEVTSRLLARHGLARNDIAWRAVHPASAFVLAQVAKELELAGEALRFSYNVFENHGNSDRDNPATAGTIGAGVIESSVPLTID